jgi:hypothetical protein
LFGFVEYAISITGSQRDNRSLWTRADRRRSTTIGRPTAPDLASAAPRARGSFDPAGRAPSR